MNRSRPTAALFSSDHLDDTDDRALYALVGLLTAVHGTLPELPLRAGVSEQDATVLSGTVNDCRLAGADWEPLNGDYDVIRTCYSHFAQDAGALLHPTVVRAIIGHEQVVATAKGVQTCLLKWLRTHLRANTDEAILTGLLVTVVAADIAFPLTQDRAFVSPSLRPVRVLLVDALRRAGRTTPFQVLTVCPPVLPSRVMAWIAAQTTRSLTDTLAVNALARSDAERALADVQASAEAARLSAQSSAQQVTCLMKQLAIASTGQLRAEQRAAALDQLAGPARLEQARLSETLGRTRAHVDVLQSELDAARAECAEYQALLSSLTEPEAAQGPAPDLVPAADIQFSGERVFVYTNQARADVRAQMGQRFLASGAGDVSVFYSDRDEGPERIPADVMVVIDVTFMPHKQSEKIEERARRAGVPCYVGRHGVSTIAIASAKALIGRQSASERRPALSLAS